MLFNSVEFLFFLPIVFCFYWYFGIKSRRVQNVVLLIASYIFYGWWSWNFLLLIFISSITDYLVGLSLASFQKQKVRNLLLATSIAFNLGLLFTFKYYNFFIENLRNSIEMIGFQANVSSLNLILPVGISFYTFQTMSYTIDIYRSKIKPTKDFVAFFTFVSFFPQLVAGPIERASNLLPQFYKKRVFDFHLAKDGIRQILWGLFKKVVIADICAIYANDIFNNHEIYSPFVLIMGAIYFAFQIYGDFSGYSDIAIGTAKLFGVRLMTNFKLPYFSRDIADFWRRWHISLSSWFKDYVYVPLGGSRVSRVKALRNIMIIFLVSGFWHGANWTFVAWGGINAIYFVPLFLLDLNKKERVPIEEIKGIPSLRTILSIVVTFTLTLLAWIFFRAESIDLAISYLLRISEFEIMNITVEKVKYVPLIVLLIAWEWLMRDRDHGLDFAKIHITIRWSLYLFLICLVLFFMGEKQDFIYFQF